MSENLAGATGLEPPAFGVTGRRSNQLSYAPSQVGKGLKCRSPPSQGAQESHAMALTAVRFWGSKALKQREKWGLSAAQGRVCWGFCVSTPKNPHFSVGSHGQTLSESSKRPMWREVASSPLSERGGPTMAAKKPGAQATVTMKHLAANLAETHEMSKKQTEAVLGELVGLVTKHLKKGDRIRIGGLGILQVRKRAARMGRNPATGEPIQIKASKKVAFRAAKELKESV